MPSLAQVQSDKLIKMLLMGDSGNGKTGALASLVLAGYQLFILDFDKGLDSLTSVLKDKDPTGEALKRVQFVSLSDKMKQIGQFLMVDGQTKAWPEAMRMLTEWKDVDDAGKAITYGKPQNFGKDAILVIDSSTMMGEAAMRHVKFMNGTQDRPRSQPEWGAAQEMFEKALQMLTSEDFKCNVIINTHIKYVGGQEEVAAGQTPEPMKGFPSSIGKALSEKIGAYFNIALLVDKVTLGKTTTRKIKRLPDAVISTKDPLIDKNLPTELSIEDGLAKYFEAFLGRKPSGTNLVKPT